MSPFEHSPLDFLTAMSKGDRVRGMNSEVRAALHQEMQATLNSSGTWSTIKRLLLNSSAEDEKMIRYFEQAYANIEKWISHDATEELFDTVRDKRKFGLYLRAYRSERVEELAEGPEVRIWRSVEISNIAPVSERLPLFGLCNALDMNPLRKYKSVWLPQQFRPQWQEIVHALADQAALVIINATRAGSGLSEELKMIRDFPQKTWLIAGTIGNADEFVSGEVAQAASELATHVDHVSKAPVDGGTIGEAQPQFPSWIRAHLHA